MTLITSELLVITLKIIGYTLLIYALANIFCYDKKFNTDKSENRNLLADIAILRESTYNKSAITSIYCINDLIVEKFPNHFATYMIQNFGSIFTIDEVNDMKANWLTFLPSSNEIAQEIKVCINFDYENMDIDRLGNGLDLIVQELTKYSTKPYGSK